MGISFVIRSLAKAVCFSAVLGGCCLAISDDELALLKRIDTQNTPQLRKDALALLDANPKSAVAHLVLSRAEEARANMPNALREAHAAWQVARTLPVPPEAGQTSVPTLALYRIAELYGSLDRRIEQLAWLEQYERLDCSRWEDSSHISYPAARLKVVALLKLGRVADAARYIDKVETAPEQFKVTPEQILMDRIRVAGASDKDSAAAWKLCRELEENLRSRGKRIDAGFLVNFGNYAIRRLELDKAAGYFQEAAGTINPETRFNPFQKIAEIQMARGQWAEARNSIGSAWGWLQTKESAVRLEMARSLRLTVARYYLLYGAPDKALQHLENIYAEPQRMRDSIESATRWKAEAAYTRAESLQTTWNLFGGLDESSATRPLAWICNTAASWTAKQKFASLVASVFAEPAQPLNALAITTSPWPAWWLNMPRVYGSASSRHLLESLGIDPGVRSYQSALNAVVEVDGPTAAKFANDALAALPEWDLITRARMELRVARSTPAWTDASPHYANAYRLHAPSLIGLGFPVHLKASGGMEGVSGVLQRSNSLKTSGIQSSFFLEITPAKAALKTEDGSVLREFPYEMSEQTEVTAARIIRGLFAAGPVLNEQETAVLDGRTLGSTMAKVKTSP